jgi:hypothetical protein
MKDNNYNYDNNYEVRRKHIYCRVFGVPWRMIMDSGFDVRIYKHFHLQVPLITMNYSAIANLPSSQFTRTYTVLVLVLSAALFSLCSLIYSQLFWEPLRKIHLLLLWELLCNLANICNMMHRKGSSYCCIFTGTCFSNRCLLMDLYVTVHLHWIQILF